MPSLPRIKRTRPRSGDGEVLARPEPRVQELSANGLTWIHLDAPTLEEAELLQRRFGWHPLDLEDVLSRRQRPKIDEYRDDGYLFDYCFPILDKIGHKLDSLEDDIFEGRSDEVVRDISNVKQEIISYRKIIKPERPTLRLLERYVERFLPQELELYFDDIVDASERIWDILDNYKEVVEALEDTNESAINHRQNDILRVLTVVSVILLPMTLVTGIFGMNVQFPGFGTAAAWWAIVAGMVTLAVCLAAFFRYKRWF